MNATTPLRLLAATFCTALLFACGGGGGGDPPVDQTPPTLTAQGATRAVVRKGDATPLPASFAVTVGGNPSTGTVAWKDEAGTSRGSGNTLPLNTAATALAAGEHTLTASITNPANGRSAETSFSLLVLADGAETDDDNDGLTYSQEKTAGTEPGNGDTDGDGLADGAEAGLGTDPTKADSDGNGVNDGVQLGNLAGTGGASLPPRSLMANEPGKSAGVRIEADGLSITFGCGAQRRLREQSGAVRRRDLQRQRNGFIGALPQARGARQRRRAARRVPLLRDAPLRWLERMTCPTSARASSRRRRRSTRTAATSIPATPTTTPTSAVPAHADGGQHHAAVNDRQRRRRRVRAADPGRIRHSIRARTSISAQPTSTALRWTIAAPIRWSMSWHAPATAPWSSRKPWTPAPSTVRRRCRCCTAIRSAAQGRMRPSTSACRTSTTRSPTCAPRSRARGVNADAMAGGVGIHRW